MTKHLLKILLICLILASPAKAEDTPQILEVHHPKLGVKMNLPTNNWLVIVNTQDKILLRHMKESSLSFELIKTKDRASSSQAYFEKKKKTYPYKEAQLTNPSTGDIVHHFQGGVSGYEIKMQLPGIKGQRKTILLAHNGHGYRLTWMTTEKNRKQYEGDFQKLMNRLEFFPRSNKPVTVKDTRVNVQMTIPKGWYFKAHKQFLPDGPKHMCFVHKDKDTFFGFKVLKHDSDEAIQEILGNKLNEFHKNDPEAHISPYKEHFIQGYPARLVKISREDLLTQYLLLKRNQMVFEFFLNSHKSEEKEIDKAFQDFLNGLKI